LIIKNDVKRAVCCVNLKYLILFLFSILNSQFSIVSAQPSYEFDVHYGIGASDMSLYNAPGAAVSFFFNKNAGVSAGIEYSYRQKTKTGSFSGENALAEDSEGDSFYLRYSVDKYKENFSAKVWQVPILFKYRDKFLYGSAGLKIGLLQNINAKTSYEGFETKGYYPDYNGTLSAPLYQGFGKHPNSSFQTKISSKTLFMLSSEYGLRKELNDNFHLLVGLFADYSLNEGFDRNPLLRVERNENEKTGGATLKVNDSWKSWKPWSLGVQVKLTFGFEAEKQTEEEQEVIEVPVRDHNIVVEAKVPPPPVPITVIKSPPPQPKSEPTFKVPSLPSFLLNKKPDYIFNYPETRTSPSDALHVEMLSEIATTLRESSNYDLHCVGYSEKLASESVAYETALQRSLRIKYTLNRFYGINENRLFIYSQGSKGGGYRRAECFVIF